MVELHSLGIELPVEFRLAAACAIWPHSERRQETIARTSRETIDWNRFLRVVDNHGIIGLANDGLRRRGIAVPEEPLRRLDLQARALARRNLDMAREAVRLWANFADATIPVLFIKGLPLAMLAYGTIAFRDMVDIDLLVAEEQVPVAAAALRRLGYRQRWPSPTIGAHNTAAYMRVRKHFEFVHDARRIAVELHWRLVDNPILEAKLPRRNGSTDVAIAPGMTLPTMAIDDLCVYLVIHGAQHGWSRMKWLADVAALCATDPVRSDRLIRTGNAIGASRPIDQTFLLSACLFGALMPEIRPTTVANRRVVRWLTTAALRNMTRGHGESGPDDTLFGSVGVSLSRFLLKPGLRFKWSVLQTGMTTAHDLTLLPLSDRWRFLYPALRLPLWLWRRIRGRPGARVKATWAD